MTDFYEQMLGSADSLAEPSLANGVEGWLWVWLQLVTAGLMDEDGRTRAFMESQLRRGGPARFLSHLVGVGARAVVVAQASRRDPRLRPLLTDTMAQLRRRALRRSPSELFTGAAGALVACAEVERVVPGAVERTLIVVLSHKVRVALRRRLSLPTGCLGLAHGIAGLQLALETAHGVFGVPVDAALHDRAIALLAEEALYGPDGTAAWPAHRGGSRVSVHGWCNGGPGIALALLAAQRFRGAGVAGRLCKQALRGTLQFHTSAEDFCCGAIGRAQILIEAYRQTGEQRWLAGARLLAARVRRAAPLIETGFHRGRLGMFFLEWRLRHPRRLPLLGVAV